MEVQNISPSYEQTEYDEELLDKRRFASKHFKLILITLISIASVQNILFMMGADVSNKVDDWLMLIY